MFVWEVKLVLWNELLVEELGLLFFSGKEVEVVVLFLGNEILVGVVFIVQVYVGYQFGYFNMLGDGCVVLFGE